MKPYYQDDWVTLWHGDMRTVLPDLPVVDAVIADPPYGETSLQWDRWQDGWLQLVAGVATSMWCFGSLRMYGEHWDEFGAAGWRLSQDIIGEDDDGQPVFADTKIVWEKHNGSGSAADRFKRVHEHAAHWYSGPWSEVHHETPTTPDAVAKQVRRKDRPAHWGQIGAASYESSEGGPRLMRSVIKVRSMHGRAIHPTEKPVGLLDPMIRYVCPPGGTVLDPGAGSGATAVAARLSGRRAVLIEVDEKYCERIVQRLAQEVLGVA